MTQFAIECTACRRLVRVDGTGRNRAALLAQLRSIESRLRCRACGARAGRIVELPEPPQSVPRGSSQAQVRVQAAAGSPAASHRSVTDGSSPQDGRLARVAAIHARFAQLQDEEKRYQASPARWARLGLAMLAAIYMGGCFVLNEAVRLACTHGNCVHGWYSKNTVAERRLFFAWAIGFPLLVAWVASRLSSRCRSLR